MRIRYILSLFICCFIFSKNVHCQYSALKIQFDTTIYTGYTGIAGFSSLASIYMDHSSYKKDSRFVDTHRSLFHQSPTKKNFEIYYAFAGCLWNLNQLRDAKKAFLNIYNSTEPFYNSTYYHRSDVPGDTTTNIYGYGSFSSNYKNYAAVYLAKIYIEQKIFDSALYYLNVGIKTYPVNYSCGTGMMLQENKYTSLLALCYEGFNRDQELIDLLLPKPSFRNDEILIKAIKKEYSKNDIKKYLASPENSTTCLLDTVASYSFITTNYGKNKKEKTDTLTYYSGTATIKLFEREVNLTVPELKDGEHLTKEMFIKEFTESEFYLKLTEDN